MDNLDIHKAVLEHATPDGDALIARIARVSNPKNQDNAATAPRLIKYLIKHNHWSPFQMVSCCIEVTTTRDIGRQILRHLSAIGYQEFSGRYAEYENLIPYRECRFQHPTNRQLSSVPETEAERNLVENWNEYIRAKAEQDFSEYKYWLGRGVAKEVCRSILPEGLVPTTMYLHFSLRTWLHYIAERTKEGVQAEHRLLAQQCAEVIKAEFPDTWEAFMTFTEETTAQPSVSENASFFQTLKDKLVKAILARQA